MEEVIEVEGRMLSFKDQWWLDQGLEMLKQSGPMLTDALSRMIVVDTAVLGGSLALLDKAAMPGVCKILMLVLVGLSLACALSGYFPRGTQVDLMDPRDIEQNRLQTIATKRNALYLSGILLVVGFTFGIVGASWQIAYPLAVVAAP